ncbi:hypothetical protein A7981_01925 [Methylovorus sp. MM2]|uniref:golvesin C-terminal-like domain-containing protein n=1 Tax=Methylovorus sp. MM2 TaxID=1848038 RepID=UPI0007E27E71|nr:RHS repeat-associated core domain-containing protein [Methylovorus sp. MM2]OAM52271.1 hypothetical protein A7981_01925 [Methylovorus sp. MM2]
MALVNGHYGTNYVNHTTTASTADNVLYSITPTATQNYRVYARWIAATTNATNATYTINPNTTGSIPTTVTVDQTKSGGTWNYLGSYDLDIANNLTVSLSGQGNGAVIADAVRIVPNTTSTIQSLTYFVFADYLNTPRRIKNAANQTVWHWLPELSEAFGANLPNDNPSGLGTFTYNLRFPGQLYDSASGLIYNYYRDYNSRTGRYIESDPIGLKGGINAYGYVEGNPVSYIDEQGLLLGATLGGLQRGVTLDQATQIGLMGHAALKAGGVAAVAGAGITIAATGAPEASAAVCRIAPKLKKPCKNATLALVLGTGICKGDPADDYIQDIERKESIRRGAELIGQKKIGNQQQRP